MENLIVDIKKKEFKTPSFQALGRNSFEIRPGTVNCIVGPSGCGKTTLLRLIAGLDKEFQGTIKLGNKENESESSVVFQDARLLPWLNVKENVEFGLQQGESSISDKLLRLVSLEKFAKSYPHQLSGGMAQKAALARALAKKPKVLLLDEPFASLDKITRTKMQEELLAILKKEKITSILVTHDLEEALYLGDKVLIMSKRPGKVVKQYYPRMKTKDRTSKEFLKAYVKLSKHMKKAHVTD